MFAALSFRMGSPTADIRPEQLFDAAHAALQPVETVRLMPQIRMQNSATRVDRRQAPFYQLDTLASQRDLRLDGFENIIKHLIGDRFAHWS